MKKDRMSRPRKVSPRVKSEKRMTRAYEYALPTAPNQYGTVALNRADITPRMARDLGFFINTDDISAPYTPTVDLGILTQGTTDVGVGYNFTLSSCPGYADELATYDQYMLVAVFVEFSPQVTTNSMPTSSTSYFPRLYTAIDYNDSNTPSRAAVQAFGNCVPSPPGTGIVRAIHNELALAAYSGTFTSYVSKAYQWIDANSPNVQHYGIKAVVEAGMPSQTAFQSFVVTARPQFKFRRTR